MINKELFSTEPDISKVKITDSFTQFSEAARKRFEETFYYRKYNDSIKKIID